MKRKTLILISLCLILALAACGKTEAPAPEVTPTPGATEAPTPEPTPTPTAETWYGLAGNTELCLSLWSDGTYTLAAGSSVIPSAPSVILSEQSEPKDLSQDSSTSAQSASAQNDTLSGTWVEKDGSIYLDGEEAPTLIVLGDRLSWPEAGLFLTAEKPEVGAYTPAEPLTGADAALLNGYWTSLFVQADGAILPAADLNDRTDVYIEVPSPGGEGGTAQAVTDEVSPRAALGGPLFGDTIVDMTASAGALTHSADGATVTLALQQDGFLRLTLTTPDGDMVIYLQRTYVEGLDPAPEG